jgi:RNA polymerase sigma factor FliA
MNTAEQTWQEHDLEIPQISAAEESVVVERYAHLVKRAAYHLRSMVGVSVDKDDLYQVGFMGLLTAVRRYGRSIDEQFEAYAFMRIRGAMLDEFRRNDWRPRQLRQQAHKFRDAVRRMRATLGREPTDQEISEDLGISLDELSDLYYLDQAESMETLSETIEQFGTENDDDSVEEMETRLSLDKVLATLPDRHRLLLHLYYTHELNMKEVALVLNLTESRVCQLHKQSIQLLSSKIEKW